MNTAEILKKLRKEKGLSQSDIAKILDIDRTTYTKYEKGGSIKRSLEKLTDFYNVSADYLLGNEYKTDTQNTYVKETAEHIYANQSLQKLFDIARQSSAKNIQIVTTILEQLNKGK